MLSVTEKYNIHMRLSKIIRILETLKYEPCIKSTLVRVTNDTPQRFAVIFDKLLSIGLIEVNSNQRKRKRPRINGIEYTLTMKGLDVILEYRKLKQMLGDLI